MPAKNRIKEYQAGGFYHLYNRGVEGRNIFLDDQDYAVFLSYLKEYLEPKPEIEIRDAMDKVNYYERDKLVKKLAMNNFNDEIKLLCFCLMPNHYHFLLRQDTKRGIEKFMKSLFTRYVGYFNKKYDRIGFLFQGNYKGVLVENNLQLIYLIRYIHQNPNELSNFSGSNAINYPYSSLGTFIGKQKINWVKHDEVKKIRDSLGYRVDRTTFLKESLSDEELQTIKYLTLDT